jgi:hypothetical protein
MGRNIYINLGGLKFHGPYNFIDHIEMISGVYAILCESRGKITVIEIGEGDDLNLAIKKQRRSSCWGKNCKGWLKLAAYYCEKHERVQFAKASTSACSLQRP